MIAGIKKNDAPGQNMVLKTKKSIHKKRTHPPIMLTFQTFCFTTLFNTANAKKGSTIETVNKPPPGKWNNLKKIEVNNNETVVISRAFISISLDHLQI